MHRQRFVQLMGIALAALLAAPASALPLTKWGATASTATADCPSFCTNFDFGASGGGENQTTASSSISNLRGQAQAFAALDPSAGLSLPVLKAEAYSSNTGQGSAFATAFAVEGYTYLGGGTGDFTLDITLTGSVSDPTPADLDTTLTATVYVFAEDPFEFISDIGTLIFEYGAVAIDSTVLSISGNETDGIRTGAVSFSLAPGESVYVFTRLSADAERELSFADAFSTLTVDFEDPTGLAAASAVPEPTTLLLTGAGLFALAARRQRERRRSAVRRGEPPSFTAGRSGASCRAMSGR